MIVNNSTSTPFTPFKGRAPVIKNADKICRSINSDFPHLSPGFSWMKYAQPIKQCMAFVPYWSKLDDLHSAAKNTNTAYDYFDVLIKKLRENKCANGADLSNIAYLKCMNKNYDDVKCVQLGRISPNTGRKILYDHVAVSFKCNNKEVLIDPLFEFADFVPNCFLKYKTVFKRFISGFNENFNLTLFNADSVKINPEDLKNLTKKYKDLIG